jgi:hypothetical protein
MRISNFSFYFAFVMRMKKIIAFIFLLLALSARSQTGGQNAFAALDLTFSARALGLANDFISVKDQDIGVAIVNPSLLNDKMHNMLSFNHAFLSGGINYGMVGYGRKMFGGNISASIRYIDYGFFRRTAVDGTEEGSFSPFDCVIGAGYGKQINPRISVGANVNFILSQMEIYNAFGMAVDLGGTYTNENENLLVTALVKNAGVQFNNYYSTEKDPLPAEFQMAMSYKLNHAPFRFSILAHHLNRWDITYNDPSLKPTIDALTGDTIPVPRAGFIEKLARHFSYQAEVMAGKRVHLRFGFDYHRRQELKIQDRPGIAGFTFGTGLYFRKITIDYGFSIYSRAGFNHMLSLSTNFGLWKK